VIDLKSKQLSNQPYRLYRFTVPSSLTLLDARSIAFAGAYMSVSTVTVARVQALWITAYFGNDIPSLGSKSSYADNKIEWNTVLHSQFGKWRHPAAGGGYGERVPDMAFDSLPFVDLLLKDLGLLATGKVAGGGGSGLYHTLKVIMQGSSWSGKSLEKGLRRTTRRSFDRSGIGGRQMIELPFLSSQFGNSFAWAVITLDTHHLAQYCRCVLCT
jgi:hypothetical protein